jgi:hypothetical protein
MPIKSAASSLNAQTTAAAKANAAKPRDRRISFLSAEEERTSPIDRSSSKDRELLYTAVIHAADLSNPTLEFSMAKKWAHLVVEEFYAQHLKEEEHGIPSSQAMMNPPSNLLAMAELQVGFIEFVVSPLWHSLASYFPELCKRSDVLALNREKWKKVRREEQAKTKKAK